MADLARIHVISNGIISNYTDSSDYDGGCALVVQCGVFAASAGGFLASGSVIALTL